LFLMETFAEWLKAELDARSWTNSDLARAGGIQPATLSRIISGARRAGPDVCLAIARALREPPERVFRLAGLLPPLPSSVEEEQEALVILRTLPSRTRATVMTQLRALAGHHQPASQRTSPPASTPIDEADLEDQLLEEFRRLPSDWQQHAIEEVERLQSLHTLTVRIIGDEDEAEEDEGIPSEEERDQAAA
jgi:transcriptional regulator with XRE-family HTH domain